MQKESRKVEQELLSLVSQERADCDSVDLEDIHATIFGLIESANIRLRAAGEEPLPHAGGNSFVQNVMKQFEIGVYTADNDERVEASAEDLKSYHRFTNRLMSRLQVPPERLVAHDEFK